VGANLIGCETGHIMGQKNNTHITHPQNRKKVKLSCSWSYQPSSLLTSYNKCNWKWCHVLRTSKISMTSSSTKTRTAILTVCIWLRTGIKKVMWSQTCDLAGLGKKKISRYFAEICAKNNKRVVLVSALQFYNEKTKLTIKQMVCSFLYRPLQNNNVKWPNSANF